MRERTTTIACIAAMTLGAALPATAAEGQWTLGLSGGTLGAGPEVAYRFGTHLGVRANAGFFSISRSEELDDVDYDGDIDLNSFGAMLDWYPMGGGFRVSLGARANNTEIDIKGTPTTNVEIGSTTYTPAQIGTLTGTITTDDFAPALTLGYGGTLAEGFTFGFELGVLFQGSPEIENLRSTNGLLSTNPVVLANLRQEELRIEEDAEDYEYWPVLQLHFLYRF